MSYSWKGAPALYIMNWFVFHVTCINLEESVASCLFFCKFFFRKHVLQYRDFSHFHISFYENNTYWSQLWENGISTFTLVKILFCSVPHLKKYALVLISIDKIYFCYPNYAPHSDAILPYMFRLCLGKSKALPNQEFWVGSFLCLLI